MKSRALFLTLLMAALLPGWPAAAGVADFAPAGGDGIFVATSSGDLLFGRVGGSGRLPISQLERLDAAPELGGPPAIACRNGRLHLLDTSRDILYSFDVETGAKRAPGAGPALVATGRGPTPDFSDSARVTVWSDGTVVVLDAGDEAGTLHTLDPDDGWSLLGTLPAIEAPSAVVFPGMPYGSPKILDSADGSVHALRRERAAPEGGFVFGLEAVSVPDRVRGLTEYRGIVYLLTRDRLAIQGQDVASTAPFPEIGDPSEALLLAATEDSLVAAARDGDSLLVAPRPVPALLEIRSGARDASVLLLELYTYLDPLGLLPWREVVPGDEVEDLEALLRQEDALVGRRFQTQRRWIFPTPRSRRMKQDVYLEKVPLEDDSATDREWKSALRRFSRVFCDRNPRACSEKGDEVDSPLPAGVRLEVPGLDIETRLGRTIVDLDGRPVSWHLGELVFDPRLLETVDADLVVRLNPRLRLSSDTVLEVDEGELTLPFEVWTLDVTVPSAAVSSRPSELTEIVGDAREATIVARQRITAMGRSLLRPQPPGGEETGETGDDPCAFLRERMKALHEAIEYPEDYPPLEWANPAVAIVEDVGSLDPQHHVFRLDPRHPAWYEPQGLDLEPLETSEAEEEVVSADVFTADDHGTHVSALIGGRTGECWSGLLPNARLTRIDPTGVAELTEQTSRATDADVYVFNVSQEYEVRTVIALDEFERYVDSFRDRLIVTAAGEEARNLNQVNPMPLARWGDRANVITVSCLGAEGEIRQEADFGKKFIDLLAPGTQIYSATDLRKFGPADGSSQAAPLVSAAAAYLLWEGVAPGHVKSRLIATARWHPSHMDEVWGGDLNFGAAVMFPERNKIRLRQGNGPGPLHTFRLENQNLKVKIETTTETYVRSGEGEPWRTGDKIPFKDILSLQRTGSPTSPQPRFRVVFMDRSQGDEMSILLDARLTIDKPILCAERTAKRWRPGTEEWEASDFCDRGIPLERVHDYVAEVSNQREIQW